MRHHKSFTDLPNLPVFLSAQVASCAGFLLLGTLAGAIACGGGGQGAPSDAGTLTDGSTPSDAGTMDGGGDGDGGDTDGGGADGGSGGPVGETVVIDSGLLHGSSEGELKVFRGVPYAQAPVGALRFAAPKTPLPFNGTREATQFSPACPQRDHTGALTGDEDCLTLNVWAPAAGGARPVMVFLHGGAFVQGAASLPTYDGASLASQGALVVVSLQYRLGTLGFLATDQLIAEGPGAGNYGILDQQMALAWVQRNIHAFGGDPSQVTLFGESAGGISVCVHLGAPSSDGLFSRAIIESGTGCYGLRYLRRASPNHSSAVDQGDQVVTGTGCGLAVDPLACMRALPAFTLVDAGARGPSNGLGLPDFSPTIDNKLLSEEPFDRVMRAEHKVPLISGSNADEAATFTTSLPIPNTLAYEAQVRASFPLNADAVLALYPAGDFASPKAAYNALLSDVSFICPALSFVDQAGSAGFEARSYHFTHLLSGAARSWGAFHALELWFLFGTTDTLPAYFPNASDGRVSDTMQRAWTDFAYGRSPLATLPWPASSTQTPSIALIDDPIALTHEIRQGRCAGLVGLGLVR